MNMKIVSFGLLALMSFSVIPWLIPFRRPSFSVVGIPYWSRGRIYHEGGVVGGMFSWGWTSITLQNIGHRAAHDVTVFQKVETFDGRVFYGNKTIDTIAGKEVKEIYVSWNSYEMSSTWFVHFIDINVTCSERVFEQFHFDCSIRLGALTGWLTLTPRAFPLNTNIKHKNRHPILNPFYCIYSYV